MGTDVSYHGKAKSSEIFVSVIGVRVLLCWPSILILRLIRCGNEKLDYYLNLFNVPKADSLIVMSNVILKMLVCQHKF